MKNNLTQAIKYTLIILVIIGITGSLGKYEEKIQNEEGKNVVSNLNFNNVMFGIEDKIENQNIKGININNVMGGVELDFTNASFENNAKIEIFSLMGGVQLTIPKDWKVVKNNSNVMGGTEDFSLDENQVDSSKTIIIDGSILLSGLEIIRK